MVMRPPDSIEARALLRAYVRFYRPEDVRRLESQWPRYRPERIAQELFGRSLAAVVTAPTRELAVDWRAQALAEQASRVQPGGRRLVLRSSGPRRRR